MWCFPRLVQRMQAAPGGFVCSPRLAIQLCASAAACRCGVFVQSQELALLHHSRTARGGCNCKGLDAASEAPSIHGIHGAQLRMLPAVPHTVTTACMCSLVPLFLLQRHQTPRQAMRAAVNYTTAAGSDSARRHGRHATHTTGCASGLSMLTHCTEGGYTRSLGTITLEMLKVLECVLTTRVQHLPVAQHPAGQ